MSIRTSAPVALTLAGVGVMMALIAPATAAASVRTSAIPSSNATVTSPTNPVGGWRGGWGDSLDPQFQVSGLEGAVGGLFYVTDRSATTVLATDTTSLGGYSRTVMPTGTHFSQTLDLPGILAFPPPGGWPPAPVGASTPIEGSWAWHFLPYSLETSSGALVFDPQVDAPFSIDVTPPRPVRGVMVTPSQSVPASTTAVGATSRVTVRWQGEEYDDLAGTAYFSLYLDGQPAISGAGTATIDTPVGQPPMWYDPAWTFPYEASIEDLSPGRHTFSVTAVDRATNESARSASAIYYSDTDAPTISWSRVPTSPVNARQPAVFHVTATDSCLKNVTFLLDGVQIGVVPADPANMHAQSLSLTKPLGGYANGTHIIIAIARDQFGRGAATGAAFVIDKTAPTLTSVALPLYSDAFTKSTFYPVKHDRYWDTSTLRYRVSERSIVALEVHAGTVAGPVIRSFAAYRAGAGSGAFTWDGRSSTNTMSTGTFYYVLRAVDAAGNLSSAWSHVVRIKSYQIVRLSRSRVKAIPR